MNNSLSFHKPRPQQPHTASRTPFRQQQTPPHSLPPQDEAVS